MAASGIVTPTAAVFLGEALDMMIPWFMAVFAAVIADLIAGIRKSLTLGVRVSPSSAMRATMGKIVVYFAFVLMVCMVDAAAKGGGSIAKWCCLFIMGLELGSVASNLLKPYGIDLTIKSIIRLILNRSPLQVTSREADDLFNEKRREEMADEERRKWEHKGKSNSSKRTKTERRKNNGKRTTRVAE